MKVTVLTSFSSDNDNNPMGDNSLTEMIAGKWIHTDTDGSTYTITVHLTKME